MEAYWTLRRALQLLYVAAVFAPLAVCAQDTLPVQQGFTHTAGGRDGRLVRVTTLEPRGPGSLAEALAATGPRIIVFEVGGGH